MTIEYKDSKRIVALEADVATTEEAFSFTTTDTVNALWGNRIYGMKLLSGHSGLNKYIKKIKTHHPTNPTGSRLTTGTLYHVILDSSGTEIARSAGVSASSVSNNSWAETTFSSAVKLLENYTVGATISTGDANTYLGIGVNNNSSSPTNTTRYYKDQSGNESTSTSESILTVFDSDPATGVSIPSTWTWEKEDIRGLFMGGDTGSASNVIDYITIATLGNATDFGDLVVATYDLGACSSHSRGVYGGGNIGSFTNNMGYVTIATAGNATDFGNLTVARGEAVPTASNRTRGLWGGGWNGSANVNTIDYVTIDTTGNAIDFGDLTASRRAHAGSGNSGTRGLWAGGYVSSFVNTIDYVTIATLGNAVDFGDLTASRGQLTGLSNTTRTLFAGGGSYSNTIDYVTNDTTGDATDFGNLTASLDQVGTCSSTTKGVMGGGSTGSYSNVIQYVTIATEGDASDFGDLTVARGQQCNGASGK